MADTYSPEKESFWKSVFGRILKSLLFGGLIFVLSYTYVHTVNEESQTKQIFWVMYYLVSASIFYFAEELSKTKGILKATSDEIAKQNQETNLELLRIATEDIENKIIRKLVFTNAVVQDRNNKLAITAKILNDFPDETKYTGRISDADNTESIDVVRLFSYQDLLFTPQYLNYLFYRIKHSKKGATRIVVIDEPCQATVSYLFLSCAIGYKTFVISSYRFKLFYNQFCRVRGKETPSMIIIKGNPFMTKTENENRATYDGEYVDYRKRIEHNGDVKAITDHENIWQLLLKLCEASSEINHSDALTIDSIRTIITNKNRTELPA